MIFKLAFWKSYLPGSFDSVLFLLWRIKFFYSTSSTSIAFQDSQITKKKYGFSSTDMFCLYMKTILHLLLNIQVSSMFLLNSVKAKASIYEFFGLILLNSLLLRNQTGFYDMAKDALMPEPLPVSPPRSLLSLLVKSV